MMSPTRRQCASTAAAFLSLFVFSTNIRSISSFVTSTQHAPSSNHIFARPLNEEIEDSSQKRAQQKRAQGGGTGETVAGAVLGGLVLGPFGALFGAQLGASFGSARALDKARKEEMEKLGITKEMLEMAEECGAALTRSIDGLKATRESLEAQQRFARKLDNAAEQLYEKAQTAIASSDEDGARNYLFERQLTQEKLKKTLRSCAEERKRLEIMERNVEALEQRAMEVESLLRRSAGAKSLQDSSDFSLSNDDPLLQKFRDMGID